MADLVGTDIATGDEVKWYHGGVVTTETFTTNGATITDNIIALSGTAEYGSLWTTRQASGAAAATALMPIELATSSTTNYATDSTNTKCFRLIGWTSGDTIVAKYIDVATTGLTHIASCRDVRLSRAIDSKSTAVQGQSTKLKKTGASDLTLTLGELSYSEAFLGALYGDYLTSATGGGETKYGDHTSGSHKVESLVGMRFVSNVVKKKWFVFGLQPSRQEVNMPTEDWYAHSFDTLADNVIIFDFEA